MGNFLPQIGHNQVCGIHKLVEVQLVNKSVGRLSIPIEDGWFFSLKGFFISSKSVWVCGSLGGGPGGGIGGGGCYGSKGLCG